MQPGVLTEAQGGPSSSGAFWKMTSNFSNLIQQWCLSHGISNIAVGNKLWSVVVRAA